MKLEAVQKEKNIIFSVIKTQNIMPFLLISDVTTFFAQ